MFSLYSCVRHKFSKDTYQYTNHCEETGEAKKVLSGHT